ncbi:MAG TPA: PAC2 family protein [Candidatus Norongarragalinales archaeon]|nr:PAC2 family protein [Candidatus Norongarragalinales archaeon]
MMVEIKEIEKVNLKNPIVIEGFPGIGMVGPIAASFLAGRPCMKLVGYISSTHFPPIAAIHDYKPVSPARVYACEDHNMIVLFSEFVIPSEIVLPLARELIEYARKKKAKAIYSLAGIASELPQDTIHGIASTPAVFSKLKSGGVELIKEGATQGVSGVLIAECAAQKFPAANLMIETNKPLDPSGCARLLDFLGKMAGFKIDTKPLNKEGEQVEQKMKDAIEKMQSLHKDYKQMEENPMYG